MKGGGVKSRGGGIFTNKKWKLHSHQQKIKKLYSLFRQIFHQKMLTFSEFSILKFCPTIIFCKDLVQCNVSFLVKLEVKYPTLEFS